MQLQKDKTLVEKTNEVFEARQNTYLPKTLTAFQNEIQRRNLVLARAAQLETRLYPLALKSRESQTNPGKHPQKPKIRVAQP